VLGHALRAAPCRGVAIWDRRWRPFSPARWWWSRFSACRESGAYFVQGALNRDYTLVMGVVICYAALIILLNFLADIAYRFWIRACG
jgi:hypothetical protein